MKYLSFFFLLATLTINSVQGQIQVPTVVSQQFETQFPNATTPHWEYREGAIVAMFQAEGLLTKAFYEKDGQWRETRTRIELAALPAGVGQFIATNYQDAAITYIGRVETNNGNLFRIESEFSNSVVIKTLTPEGKLIQEEWVNYSLMDQRITAPLPTNRAQSVKEIPK